MNTELYKSIMNSLNIGYAYHKITFNKKNEVEDLQLTDCSQLFLQIVNLDKCEIINKFLSEIIVKEENKLINVYKNLISSNQLVNHQLKIKICDKYYYVKIYSENKNYLITAISDITHQITQMDRIILEVCDKIKSNILVANPQTGELRYANSEACSFYGYSLEEMANKSIYDFIVTNDNESEVKINDAVHEFSSEPINQLIDTAISTGKSQGLFFHKLKSDKIKQVLVYFTFIQFCGEDILFVVIQDKTEMFNIARKLQDNEVEYRILFDEAPLSYQSLDKEARFITVNKEWLKLLGYEEHEVIGKWFGDFLVEEYKDQFRLSFLKFKQSGISNIVLEMYKKNKEKVIVDIKGRVRFDELGNYTQSHCILSDITGIVKAQEKEKALNKAKNEFLAIISHEVRTPLTSILGLNQLMMHTNLDKIQRDYINKISNAGSSLLGIINDMLDITKYESGKLDVESLPFSFDNFMNNIITINKMRAEKSGNKFEYEYDKNIPNYLIGDALRLGQVINNILGNSIKFTHMGKIKLAIRLIGRSINDTDIQIVIRDNGIGMSKDQVEKLFKPFEQADASFKRKYGGSGLGMAISKQLIDLMGGDIKVESIHGDGTIFIINLNFKINNNPQEEEQSLLSKKAKKEHLKIIEGKKILVVEDHKINQKIICDLLNFYNLNIETANNGIEALDKVKQKDFDLILMDIQMPIMDGLTATEQIRKMEDEKKRNTPILAMTAHAMKEEYTKSLESGMNGHLTKPINIKVLEENLFRYLAGEEIVLMESQSLSGRIDNELIDIRMGLMRFRHDAKAYKSSLNEFLEYKDSDSQLLRMLNNNDLEQATRYLHSIKGIAGNLSINRLSKSADELKNTLTELSQRSKEYNISTFSDNLQKVMNAIESEEVFAKIDTVMHKYVEQ